MTSQLGIAAGGERSLYPYKIGQSLRLAGEDSSYLSWTPASAASDRTAFTFSCWVKLAKFGADQGLFSVRSNDNTRGDIRFRTSDILIYLDRSASTNQAVVETDAPYRDPSSWYNVIVSYDSDNATQADRLKFLVNGVRQNVSGSPLVSSGELALFGYNFQHRIGLGSLAGDYLYGHLAEVIYIDGTTYDESAFGEFRNGIWVPKNPAGLTFGANGFYLDFADSADLGKDVSGNGNDFTPTNITSDDQVPDSPTNNYCTLNTANNQVSGTISEAGLYVSHGSRVGSTGAGNGSASTFGMLTGKWYWEVEYVNNDSQTALDLGITPLSDPVDVFDVGERAIMYQANAKKYVDGTNSAYGTASTTGDVIGVLADCDARNIDFYHPTAGWMGTINFSDAGIADDEPVFAISANASTGGSNPARFNFGQFAFTHSIPAGAKTLCAENLPEPTIGPMSATQADDHFDIALYTGNGSSLSISSLLFQPDFVWIKQRDGAGEHKLIDAVRGATNKLASNVDTAEQQETNGLTSFDSDGFSLGSDAAYNGNGDAFVAWNWKADNTAGSSNTDGTITSTVAANTDAGFSIVSYTGNLQAAQSVGHGLGRVPKMIIIKSRTDTRVWVVYHFHTHPTTPEDFYLQLHTNSSRISTSAFDSTQPDSSVFYIGNSTGVNDSGDDFIAYCFAEIPGFSKFGTWPGDGSADGKFLYCGFKPRYVLMKKSSGGTGIWVAIDVARDPENVATLRLEPDTTSAEATTVQIDILSNGFKLRSSSGNASGDDYIFAAFAEHPFKYANAR